MTITAKYPGRCKKCGGQINVGDKIEWERGKGAEHVECPAHADSAENIIEVWHGSGYGYCPATGETFYDRESKQWLTVLRQSSHYYAEDGLSFGVGEDSGYMYTLYCRPATTEETAPIFARMDAKKKLAEIQDRIKAIEVQIKDNGERPEENNTPGGERAIDTQTIYGGGSWFVISEKYIWFVLNNGADGDNWSLNNVDGRGIGWRIDYDATLANELHELEIAKKEQSEKAGN